MSCDVALMNYVQQVKGMLLLANVELAVAVEAADFLRNPLAPAGALLVEPLGLQQQLPNLISADGALQFDRCAWKCFLCPWKGDGCGC